VSTHEHARKARFGPEAIALVIVLPVTALLVMTALLYTPTPPASARAVVSSATPMPAPTSRPLSFVVLGDSYTIRVEVTKTLDPSGQPSSRLTGAGMWRQMRWVAPDI
jgi:hypothetical protein